MNGHNFTGNCRLLDCCPLAEYCAPSDRLCDVVEPESGGLEQMKDFITRIFNPSRYWRQRLQSEVLLHQATKCRFVEATQISEIRLGTIIGHEREIASMRDLLGAAHGVIANLDRELNKVRAELAPFKTKRARDEKGHFLKESVQ